MVYIRCDSSFDIGTGHVRRCLFIAEKFRSLGENVEFICFSKPGDISSQILERGFNLSRLNENQSDIELLKSKASSIRQKKDLLIVDSYNIDFKWEEQLIEFYKILVVDDMATNNHACHFILNQNYRRNIWQIYLEKLTKDTNRFLGSTYVLSNPAEERISSPEKNRNGLLVFFGGTDPTDESTKFIGALSANLINCPVTIVTTKANQNYKYLLELNLPKNVTVIVEPKNWNQLLTNSELFLGSGGTVNWERSMRGLSGFIISTANNQHEIAEDLAKEGAIVYLGPANNINYVEVIDKINSLIENKNEIKKMGRKALDLVKPIPDQIFALIHPPFKDETIRFATFEDSPFVMNLRNSPEGISNSRVQKAVSFEEHQNWFKLFFKTKYNRMYIFEYQGVPIGQFRVNDLGDVGVILNSEYRGKGFGAKVIQLGSNAYKAEFPDRILKAEIREENISSIKAFLKSSYIEKSSRILDGKKFVELSLG